MGAVEARLAAERDAHDHDGHDHAHDHDHLPHPKQPDEEDAPLAYYQVMEVAVRELLIGKGMTQPGQRTDGRVPRTARASRPGPIPPTRRGAPNGAAACRESASTWARPISWCSRTSPSCTTSSCARCARAIRACRLACRPTGTRAAPIGAASCRARSWWFAHDISDMLRGARPRFRPPTCAISCRRVPEGHRRLERGAACRARQPRQDCIVSRANEPG